MPRHRELNPGDIHRIHNYTYADQTAREAASGFASADIGKVAKQQDNNSYWVLTDTTPTWAEITNTTAGGGGVSATEGADGYLAFFTGANSIAGDNDLFWDRANNRLGLHTAAPNAILEVVGPDGVGEGDPTFGPDDVALFRNQGTSTDNAVAAIVSGSAAIATLFLGDKDNRAAGRLYYENSSDALSLWSNNIRAVTIDSGQYVGIGPDATSPSGIRLLVQEDHDGDTQIRVRNDTAGSSSLARITAIGEGNNFSVASYSDSHGSRSGENWIETTAGLTDVVIGTAAGEVLRLDSSGDVAIGGSISSASAQLTIVSNDTFTLIGTDSTTDNAQKLLRIATLHYDVDEEPFMPLYGISNSTQNRALIGGGTGAANASTDITFWTAANNTTLTGTERMRITSDGVVGIGGAGNSSWALDVSEHSSGGVLTANAYGYGQKNSSGTAQQILSYADANFSSTGNDLHLRNANTNAIYFWTDATKRMNIDSGGQVTIGDVTPQSLDILTVSGDQAGAPIRICVDNTNATGKATYIFRNSGTYGGWLEYDFELEEMLLNAESGNLKIQTLRKTAIAISEIQNIGIGTLDPQEALTINGAIALQSLPSLNSDLDIDGYGRIYVNDDEKLYFRDKDGTEFDLTSGGGGVSATEGSDGYIAFFTGSGSIAGDNNLFYDRVGGKLSITGAGAADPLTVRGTLESAFRAVIDNESPNGLATLALKENGNYRAWFEHDNSSGETILNAHEDTLLVKTQNTTALTIDSSQQVGIGASPDSSTRLYVDNGTGGPAIVGVVSTSSTSVASNNALTARNNDSTNDNVEALMFRNSAGGFVASVEGVNTNHNTTGTATGYLRFITNNAGTFDEKMQIAADGDVGIGITPSEKLHIQDTVASGNVSIRLRNLSSTGFSSISMWGNSPITNIKQFSSSWSGSVDGISQASAFSIEGTSGAPPSKLLIHTRSTAPIQFLTNDTHAMTIDGSNQRVGIGTTAPQNKLDVEGAVAIGSSYSGTDTAPTNGLIVEGDAGIGTNSPACALDIDGGTLRVTNEGTPSSGVGLEIEFQVGERKGEILSYDRDQNAYQRLELRGYKINLETDGVDSFWVSQLGHVGVGTEFPVEPLTVNGVIALQETAAPGNNNDGYGKLYAGTDSELHYVDDSGNDTQLTTAPSDIQLKDNIRLIDNALSKVMEINGVKFEWNQAAKEWSNRPTGETEVGLIAQEVEKVLPEVVRSGMKYKSIKYDRITSLLVEAVKELKQKNDELTARIEKIEAEKKK